jgi:phosphoglycerol transferase
VLALSLAYLLNPASLPRRFGNVCREILRDPSSRKTHGELFREITGLDYEDLSEITVKLPGRRKNLVILELESLEQRFLEKSPGVTKDLLSLTREGEFYSDIPMIEGSSWTIAGIHTFLCGTPMIYSLQESTLMKTALLSRLVCLPDVLRLAGYRQVYVGGEGRTFSGKSQFLLLHGYDEVLGKKELHREYGLDKKNYSGWGARDRDVFEVAKDKYRKLQKSGKPFSLMVSTLDSHGIDNGLRDGRCRNTTGNQMLDTVECTNDLLRDFVDFLRSEPGYENTLLLILPDHLMMGDFPALGVSASDGSRRLYALLLNSGSTGKESATLLYTDIPALLLRRLGIEHSARFLLERRGNQSLEERLEHIGKNLGKIRSFNNRTLLH